jgi:electron transfer flavoprotein beta subunit
VLAPADIGIGGETAAFATVRVDPPPQRSKGIMVKDVGELVAALKQKGLV